MTRLALLAALATLIAAAPAPAAKRTTVAKLPFPTNIAFDPTGTMWVTSGAGGRQPSDGVWRVPRSGRPQHVAKNLSTALGLTWHGGELFVSHTTSESNGRVTAYSGYANGRFAKKRIVVAKFRVGRHTMDSIVPGPDGRLYVGVGSVEDSSGPPGRIVSFLPSGKDVRTAATGLRNPYGLAFLPGTSTLLVTDNARDDLGPFKPPEELNAFDTAAPGTPHFGFPRCPSTCRAPIAKLPAHASSNGIAITADGRTAYIAQYGSSFYRQNPTGRDVQRLTLDADGKVTGRKRFDKFAGSDPLGAAIGPDGDLYVTLLLSGKIVRYDLTS